MDVGKHLTPLWDRTTPPPPLSPGVCSQGSPVLTGESSWHSCIRQSGKPTLGLGNVGVTSMSLAESWTYLGVCVASLGYQVTVDRKSPPSCPLAPSRRFQ